jgi:Glycosyl transferase family 11
MIAVDRRGRLGNQMFQYAFGVAAAQRLGTRLAYDTCELEQYFVLLEPPPVRAVTRLAVRLGERVRRFERREVVADDCEDPDVILENVTNRTFYGGHFYSGQFFRPSSAAVRRAFGVREVHVKQFETKYAALLRDGYIAAHVRLTDFFTYRDDVTLPPGFYRRALAELDPELPVVIVSDEPDRVRAAFGSDPRVCVEANGEIIDFLLLKHATQLVSSNSSFAWWAAWLNERSGLQVIAPRWWLGIHAEREFPVKVIPEHWQQIDPRRPEDGEWPPV